MTNKLNLSAGVIAALAAISQAPAHAQSSAEASVEATIVGPTVNIDVTAARNLNFGEVAKPNGAIEGGSCGYDLVVYNAATAVGVATYNYLADGTRDYFNQSDCAAGGVPNYAEFTVTCSPDISVFLSLTYASTGAGVELSAPSAYPFRAGDPNGDPANDVRYFNASNVEHACSTSGEVGIFAGALLRVDETAPLGADVTVGSITLDAAYN